MKTVLADVDKNCLMMPNVAPHMARIKDYNPACDLVPLYGNGNAKDSFYQMIADAAGVNKEDILSADLFLYNRDKGYVWGPEDEFFSCPKLDDLQCAFASLQGFLQAEPTDSVAVHCVFDNEEVGSGSKQGAGGTFLYDILHRINAAFGRTEEDYMRAVASSFLVSADNAHAVHPNHPYKSDPTNRPYMNRGIVIKYNASQRYVTDAVSASIFRSICRKAGVPFQTFANRSDKLGGSTLGQIALSQVSLNAVDIGLPQLAMHSSCECFKSSDYTEMEKGISAFYAAKFTRDETGILVD
jgi:aspartyl aminopeptidase